MQGNLVFVISCRFHDFDVPENEWSSILSNIESSILEASFLKDHDTLAILQERGLLSLYAVAEKDLCFSGSFYLKSSRCKGGEFCLGINNISSHVNIVEDNELKVFDIANLHFKFQKSLKSTTSAAHVTPLRKKENDLILVGDSVGGIEIVDCRSDSLVSLQLSLPEINRIKDIQTNEYFENLVIVTGSNNRSQMADLRTGKIVLNWDCDVKLHSNILLNARYNTKYLT